MTKATEFVDAALMQSRADTEEDAELGSHKMGVSTTTLTSCRTLRSASQQLIGRSMRTEPEQRGHWRRGVEASKTEQHYKTHFVTAVRGDNAQEHSLSLA